MAALKTWQLLWDLNNKDQSCKEAVSKESYMGANKGDETLRWEAVQRPGLESAGTRRREDAWEAAREVPILNLYHIYNHEKDQASFILKTKKLYHYPNHPERNIFKSFLAKYLTYHHNRANKKHSEDFKVGLSWANKSPKPVLRTDAWKSRKGTHSVNTHTLPSPTPKIQIL